MRKIYHVSPSSNGWKSKVERGKRSSVVKPTKAEVLTRTIELAKSDGNASVVIHKANGKIQEERSYPRKSDSYPPKG